MLEHFGTLLVTMATQTAVLYMKHICRTMCPYGLGVGDATGLARHRDTTPKRGQTVPVWTQ